MSYLASLVSGKHGKLLRLEETYGLGKDKPDMNKLMVHTIMLRKKMPHYCAQICRSLCMQQVYEQIPKWAYVIEYSVGSTLLYQAIVGLPANAKHRRTWKSGTYEMF